MIACGNCGQANPEVFRFCPNCGHPAGPTVEPRTERKLVTVLFCDLAGFTTRSDRADPEDVRALLRPFHTLAKAEIERHGGTLDKFIGDAAMGVFGSPVSHEDDPERAVRAGLAILDAVRELNTRRPSEDPLEVRIGVNSGEAAITLAAGVQVGENVAGDVVNTASRLQSAAPVGAVIVGESTHRATRGAVEYQELPPVMAKGKAVPLRVWRAMAVRPLSMASERPAATPFVGREHERGLLEQAVVQAVNERRVRLVTVIGEPGAGKSRLVGELRDALPRLSPDVSVQWRRGRCLPYGEGITFWALGEIAKEQAGILESDAPAERDRKVATLLEALVPDAADRAWLRSRLDALVGADPGVPVERDEAFMAWRRFLEMVALARPLVAVFEDLHWADSAMLAFLDEFTTHAANVPLLILGTARPELHNRHPTWSGGATNAQTISLRPLSGSDTAELVSILLGATALTEEAKALLVERCGGNPLYAEELVRALQERRLTDEEGRLADDLGDLTFPDTIQSLIAARLDTLSSQWKGLLQDASVIGRVFWSGGIAFLAQQDETTVRGHLGEFAKRELIQPSPTSTVQGEHEYAFWHALIRDVAYGQIPRAARSAKHRAAAAWMETIAGEHVGDLSEILAYHATTALELAKAAGETEDVEDLERAAARYLRLAGVRTMGLDVAKAQAQLLRALELTSPTDPTRARVLANLGEAALHGGRLDEADTRYEEAISAFLTLGQRREAADAMVRRSVVLEYRGETLAGRKVLSEAIDMLSAIPQGPELARAMATSAGSLLIAGRYQEVIAEADRAIRLAEATGEAAATARAHGFRGYARAIQGDLAGIDEQRAALAALLALGVGRATAIGYNNLGSCLAHVEGSQSALAVFRDGVEFAEGRGLRESILALRDSMLSVLFEVGAWDEVLSIGRDVVEEARRQGSGYDEVFAEADRAVVLACRQGSDARELCESVLQRSRPMQDAPLQVRALLAATIARCAAGDRLGTITLLHEVLHLTSEDEIIVRAEALPHFVRLAVAARDVELAERLLEGTQALGLERYRLAHTSAAAFVAEAKGQFDQALEAYEDAIARWAQWGYELERAEATFGAARCLTQLGRPGEAAARMGAAREAFSGLRAKPTYAAPLAAYS